MIVDNANILMFGVIVFPCILWWWRIEQGGGRGEGKNATSERLHATVATVCDNHGESKHYQSSYAQTLTQVSDTHADKSLSAITPRWGTACLTGN